MTSRAIILMCLFSIALAQTTKSVEPIKYSVLAIEYVGEFSDKPITPIIISESRTGAAWYRDAVLKPREWELIYVHIVSASLFEKLNADVHTLKGTAQRRGEKNPAPSVTVSVRIITPERNGTFLYDTDLAISLLDNLQRSCGKNEPLASDLAHFRDRIRAWK